MSGCVTPTSTATPSVTATPTVTAAPSAGPTTSVRIYLLTGCCDGVSTIVSVEREVAPGAPVDAVAADAVSALLAGPTEAEANPADQYAKLYSFIPAGSRLLDVIVEGGVATVNFSRDFEEGSNPDTVAGSLGQVVFTLTQFPGVTGVMFEIEGQPVAVFGSEQFLINPPAERDDFMDLLPPVFIDQPARSSTVRSPVHLIGLANVFEATFHVRLLVPDGRSLADGPVMATCGSGCWGTFDVEVPFTVTEPTRGTLQAYVLSARDGSIENLVEQPLTLTP